MLTLKTRYAVATLISLACRGKDAFVSLGDISYRQGISPRTLAPVMQSLFKARLTKGRRGPRGGYKLARQLQEISLEQTIVAVERQPISFIASWFDRHEAPSAFVNLRVTDQAFQALDEQTEAQLRGTTIADVMAAKSRYTTQ